MFLLREFLGGVVVTAAWVHEHWWLWFKPSGIWQRSGGQFVCHMMDPRGREYAEERAPDLEPPGVKCRRMIWNLGAWSDDYL